MRWASQWNQSDDGEVRAWRDDVAALIDEVRRLRRVSNGYFEEMVRRTPGSPAVPPEGLDAIEQEAGHLLVGAARIRAARLGPDDAHELRHLWAAINAGNSDPCGVNGEPCHLDVAAIRAWTAQYPAVVTARETEPEA